MRGADYKELVSWLWGERRSLVLNNSDFCGVAGDGRLSSVSLRMSGKEVTAESRQLFEGSHPKGGEWEWRPEKEVGQRNLC